MSVAFCFITTLLHAQNEQVEIIHFEDLQQIMEKAKGEERVTVINFWATWCGPCVKEMPYFETLQAESRTNQVKVFLISLDDPDRMSRVKKLLDKKEIRQSTVKLLDEPDFNSWIDKVATEWSGAIPATLVINHQNSQKAFHEGELTQQSLNQLVEEVQ